jgi:acyl carrier protein
MKTPETKAELEKVIKGIIAEQLHGVKEAQLTPEARFVEDLGADSLDAVELGMAIEELLPPVSLSDEDWERMATVQSLVDGVAGQLNITA